MSGRQGNETRPETRHHMTPPELLPVRHVKTFGNRLQMTFRQKPSLRAKKMFALLEVRPLLQKVFIHGAFILYNQ